MSALAVESEPTRDILLEADAPGANATGFSSPNVIADNGRDNVALGTAASADAPEATSNSSSTDSSTIESAIVEKEAESQELSAAEQLSKSLGSSAAAKSAESGPEFWLARKHQDEDMTTEKWKRHRKHVFILSSAGKPIYCRYGDESRLAGLMGVLSGLVSFVSDREGDQIQSISTRSPRLGSAPLVIAFKMVGPIWLVMASSSGESLSVLSLQLGALHSQIISILTGSVQKILIQKPQFDIRNLLVGTDKCFDSLCSWMNSSCAFLLNSVHGLRLPAQLRRTIGDILLQSRRGDLFYAIMLARGQLVQLLRPRSFILYPPDLHLIINFVKSSDASFRTSEAQWTPICLPMFNDKGFLHQYISYISDDVALLLLSSKAEDFYSMQQTKDDIVNALKLSVAFDALTAQLSRQYYTVKDVGVPGLLHFLYKSLSTSQMTMPAASPPYAARGEQKRLFRLYEHVHKRTHPSAVSSTAMSMPDSALSSVGAPTAAPGYFTHRVYYHVSEKETIVAWATSGFELYATFGPLESKSACIRGCNQLLKWIKQEESSLFILDSPVW